MIHRPFVHAVLLSLTVLAGTGSSALAQETSAETLRIEEFTVFVDRLTAEDEQLDETEQYVDYYRIVCPTRQRIRLDLQAKQFDAYLMVYSEDGRMLGVNDDFGGQLQHSRIEMTCRPERVCVVAVTSYEKNETGGYRLNIRPLDGPASVIDPPLRRVRGIFVGISDYGGGNNDLPHCADDARRLHDRMIELGMAEEDAILLVDKAATIENIVEAFQRMAADSRDDDLFLFFYSGHGDRDSEDQAVPERHREHSDPDGRDEYLTVRDGDIRDNDMYVLMASVQRGYRLIALDSCFAGGFAHDVIGLPRCMGLFSSSEDATSEIADPLEAGGYLSGLMVEALEINEYDTFRADTNDDGAINSLELVQYIHDGYARHLGQSQGSTAVGDFVDTTGNPGYQHFHYERGSISPFRELFLIPSERPE